MFLNRDQVKLQVLATCALAASSSLLFFGTGPYPVWCLSWFAPLPVLLIAARIGAWPAFGIAALSWFMGELNVWHYIRIVLGIPLSAALLLLILPSCVFGIIALVYRQLIRHGALWQAALIVPILWVFYEYFMAAIPAHRTLISIGYTQMDWLPVFHLASLAGIRGVSFGLFLVPASVGALLAPQGNKALFIKGLAIAAGGLLILATLHRAWTRQMELSAEDQETSDYRRIFDRSVVMIPMRDGVQLDTEIYTPKGAKEPMPFLIVRGNAAFQRDPAHYTPALAQFTEMFPDGYIFVFQTIRGRYPSEGQFVMLRPPRNRSDPKAIDEASDAYDTIDWLVRNVPKNNGRAGLFGVSYGGWLTAMALLDPHPALKAVSVQDSPADMFLGDDFHHNGAFRLSYGFEYISDMESSRKLFGFPFDKPDTYDWYLDLGPLSTVNLFYFHGKLPTWNNFVEHPNYDIYWKAQAFHLYFSALTPTVPILNVAGWWDQEDFYGSVKIYEDLEAHDTNRMNFLVIGPWNHGGMAGAAGTKLGEVNLDSDTGAFFRRKIQAPWFAFWLHDRGTFQIKEAMIFETGLNQWKEYDAWPPQSGTTRRKLYFHPQGKLSFDPPQETDEAFDSYISDPADPVPYRHRPIRAAYSSGSGWSTWLLEDQRFVQGRSDVLTWSTPPLMEDLTVSGDIVANLFASTTGTDSDWIVKLIDALPDKYPQDPKLEGYELIISDEVFRGRFYRNFEHPAPLVPNEVVPFTVDLHTNDHVFLKGHRVLVQVQSTWFPLIDRNPQTYMPNIFTATAADYQKATQKIYRSRRFPSNIEIPVGTKQ